MKRTLAVLMFAMLLTGQAFASVYYIAASGGSDSNAGTTGSRWATFAHAFSVMHGGDTLIVGNGTYTEDITLNGQTSLNGSSGAYTTIQAENTWGATVDGSATTPAYKSSLYIYGMAYVQVIGIKFASGVSLTGGQQPVVVNSSDHIKLIKLAGYNAPCNNNTDVFDISQDTYTLVEDSHAWGCGRYKFLAYEDQNVIFRHNVARHDSSDVSGGVIGTWGRQNAQFTMYDSTNIDMQNNIAIDSGELNSSTGNLYGGIWSENNASVDNSGKYEGNIFINLKTGTSSCCYFGASINDQKLIGTREMANNAIINSTAGIWTDRTDTTVNPANLLIHHITVVNSTGLGMSPNTANEADGVGMMDVSNTNYSQEVGEDSILQQDYYYGVGGWLTSDYNIFYSNGANFGASASGHTPSAGAHDLLNTNPGLLYPVRVEAGTPGYGTASDGGNRGATILYRIGTPGTVWGETGYDTLTSTPLWPWTDEAVIKSDMASYSGQGDPGVRGFTATGNGLYGGPITLTSYIWESLGHTCPSGICTTVPTGSQPTFSPSGGTYSSTQAVTLSTSSGTVICYNTTGSPVTNGTTGCTTGTKYTTPISVAATETLYAVAGGTGLADSPVGSTTYTISTTVTTPTFSPVAGSYSSTQSVTISDSTPSSTIYYTTNGSTPTTGSTVYSIPISVSATATVKAIATASGLTTSPVGSALYTISSGGALAISAGTCTGSALLGTQKVAYAGCTLSATGGTAPYTFSYNNTPGGYGTFASIPPGLVLNSSTGAITGTNYGQGGYTVQFIVNDSASHTANVAVTFSLAGDNTLGGCTLFPSDSLFHLKVTSLPVDTSPAAPIQSAYLSSTIKPFFGSTVIYSLSPNGIPMLTVPYNQTNVAISTVLYQSYFTSGPWPWYTPIEESQNGSRADASVDDGHSIIIQTAGGGNPCRLWEMYTSQFTGTPYTSGPWSDGSNAYWANIGSTGTGAYAMLPQGNGSTDAAGLPIAPLLLNADEVIGTGTPSAPNGVVRHPTRFTLNNTLNAHVSPSTSNVGVGSCSGGYSDGNGLILQPGSPGGAAPTSCTTSSPMGEIYRLKASVTTPSCASTSPQAAIIIQGFRDYGIIVADNGATGGLIGTPDSRWNDADLACLSNVILSNFEPVNVQSTIKTLDGSNLPTVSYQTITAGTTAATPTFSPVGGTYGAPQTVTISTSLGTVICWNTVGAPLTNGTTGCSTGTLYTGPVSVSANQTLYAVAGGTSYNDSLVSSSSYIITASAVTPTFSPAAGSYTSVQNVTMSTTGGSVICYNTTGSPATNGTNGCTTGTKYTAPVAVSSSETLYAVAGGTGFTDSGIRSGVYTITLTTAATPTFSPAAGSYTSGQMVTISDATAGAVIHYTTNGSTPTTGSTVYSVPISVLSTSTVKALATASGYSTSAVSSATYTIAPPQAAGPTFSPVAGTYATTQTVSLSTASGPVICYTTSGTPATNGTTGCATGTHYTTPISVAASETIYAVAGGTGYSDGSVTSAAYLIQALAVTATPTFNPLGGTYSATQAVTISDVTAGATIYFTVDGSTPTTSSTVYSTPLSVSVSETVKAIATAVNHSASIVGSAAYTINPSHPLAPSLSGSVTLSGGVAIQ